MDTTFAEVKSMVIRVTNDEVVADVIPLGGSQSSAQLLSDAVKAALTAITTKVWKPLIKHIDLADGDGDTFTLPSGITNIEGIYEIARGMFIPELEIRFGATLAEAQTGNGWILYPNGKLTFANTLSSDGADIYYAGSWEIPVGDGDTLEPPDMSLTPIVLYAASYVFLARASATADVRQYATKIESGTPTDNPAKDMSDFFLKRYEIEMQRMPMHTRGVTR